MKEWERTKAEYLDRYVKTLKKVGETDQLITTTKESGGKVERLETMKAQIHQLKQQHRQMEKQKRDQDPYDRREFEQL